MSHLYIGLISLVAFGLLGLAMDRSQTTVWGRELPAGATRALRIGGWLFLGASLVFAVRLQGWAVGLVAWCGHISFSAALVLLALIIWDRHSA
ncbi:MAG: DUF3325 domain-containing protein [Ottowia sp.]|uniref:DUF3325 domain-containing protein n=1 Tax=unclassified Ottowia TaxID=2645081 RepID=UPI003C2D78E6